MSENSIHPSYWYGPYEGYEARCQRRLRAVLGVDETAAETIVRLRGQVIELQAQVRRLAAELSVQHANQALRLGRVREVFYEATWIELEIQG